jgi:hypothetical protein
MKRRGLWLLGALVLAGSIGPPGAAATTTNAFENYCRVGAMRTCASVRVLTTWDPVAQVTRVEMWLRNLEGSLWAENTGGAPITRIGLTAPTIRYASGLTVRTEGDAQTVGTPQSFWGITNQLIEGPVTFSAGTRTPTGATTSNGGVMGCNVFPATVSSYYRTCGEQGWVVFSFSTRNRWDASSAEVAWKVHTTAADGKHYYACRTADDPTSAEFCEVVDPTVTPEPVTVALLGTGLAGIAGFRRRRRKENAEPA